ncbi:MAG: hypothetical protein IH600_10235 [Bacteroidetes bacterium]|nr:hypothetical protein [Bacteroidota bacterium]
MKRQTLLLACLLLFSAAAPLTAQTDLHEQLLPFKDLVGHTFRGKLSEPDAKKEMWDVMHFERALNGKALRVLHSLNDGEYGGESVIFWDEAKQSLVYYYFTTAGFYTNGTMTMEGEGKWTSHEMVTGNANGVTEVRATGEFTSDGTLKTSSEYLQNGAWVPGHSSTYELADDAEVRFR